MKTSKLLIALTAANLLLLSWQLIRPSVAADADVPAVIRARALEIVDERGKVRASIAVHPEDPKVQWKGEPYPETVLFRLMSPEGRPNVKIGASKLGSGLMIGGEANPTHVQILAERGDSTLKLINQAGAERLITP
jgi:hypothetical protein